MVVIYHYPYRFIDLKSGSSVHMENLRKGFKKAGFVLYEVIGNAFERRRKINAIKEKKSSLNQSACVFSWSPTSTTFASFWNLMHPFLDLSFFLWCKKFDIPIGIFYGDVHRKFDFYKKNVSFHKRIILFIFFWADWLIYRRIATLFFIPSKEMALFLPTAISRIKIREFPPGCFPQFIDKRKNIDKRLQLLYVGSMVPPLYNNQMIIDVVEKLAFVELTICCRESEWKKAKKKYKFCECDRIKIVHESGEGLKKLYEETDIFCLYWMPHDYHNFAMPVKIFESLGFGKPVIVTEGSKIAKFIKETGIGWTVKNNSELINLLENLFNDRSLIEKKSNQARKVASMNTWIDRANYAVIELLANRKERG